MGIHTNEYFEVHGNVDGDPSRRLVSRELSCGKSQKGRCSHASTRPSTAQTAERRVASIENPMEWQSQFYHTKLCPHFVVDIPHEQAASEYGRNVGNAQGKCVNAQHCRFAHSFDQLRPLPDLSKTKLCASYANKTTCNDPNCSFAHSPKDLRTSSNNFYKVTLCNFYKNRKCWNGPNCRFAHGEQDLRPLPSLRPGRLGTVKSEQGLLPTPQNPWVRKESSTDPRASGGRRSGSRSDLLENSAAEVLFNILLSSSGGDVWSSSNERNGSLNSLSSTEPTADCHSAVSAAITSDEIILQSNGETVSSVASSRPPSPSVKTEARTSSSHQFLSVLREAFNLPSDDNENDTDALALIMEALDVQSPAEDDQTNQLSSI